MNRFESLLIALCVGAGLLVGSGAAWYIQGLRLDKLQAEYDSFVETVAAKGEAAKEAAAAKAAEDLRNKERTDRDHKADLDRLRADAERLRNARAAGRFVPAVPASSRNPGVACFDSAELERALQQFDAGISGLVAEGDESAVGLNSAREWARTLRTNPR